MYFKSSAFDFWDILTYDTKKAKAAGSASAKTTVIAGTVTSRTTRCGGDVTSREVTNSKDASNRRDGRNSTYYRDANRSKNISNSSGGISSKLIGTSWIATSSGTMAAAGMLATV